MPYMDHDERATIRRSRKVQPATMAERDLARWCSNALSAIFLAFIGMVLVLSVGLALWGLGRMILGFETVGW